MFTSLFKRSNRASLPRVARLSSKVLHAAVDAHGAHAWAVLAREHGGSFVASTGELCTAEPALVESFLMHRAHTEHRAKAYRLAAKAMPGADGLLFQDGEPWKEQLRAVMPIFHHERIDAFAATVADTLRTFARRAPDGADLYHAITEASAEIALKVLLGLDPASGPGLAVREQLVSYKLETMRVDRSMRLDVLGGPPIEAVLAAPRVLRSMLTLRDRVAIIRDELARARRAGMLDDTIVAVANVAADEQRFADWINHLYGAYNAVDYELTAALVCLARAPEWIEALRDELDAQPAAARADHRSLAALPVLRAIVRETERVCPVANAVFRQAGERFECQGESFAEGTQVMLNLYALMRHPDHWEEPDRFDPSRWIGEREAKIAERAFVPFLAGPRRCFGRTLAELVLHVGLSTIVREFDVVARADGVDVTGHFIPRFERPIAFELRERVSSPSSIGSRSADRC
ncbi:MAG: cytochrome P450 [Polyangiales bacterium]